MNPLLEKNGLKEFIKYLCKIFLKQNEILLIGQEIVKFISSSGKIIIPKLRQNTYNKIYDPITDFIKIESIDKTFNKKNKIYLQFETGDIAKNKNSIDIIFNDRVIWKTGKYLNKLAPNSLYLIEIIVGQGELYTEYWEINK